MLVFSRKDERLVGFKPHFLFGQVQLVAIEGLASLEKLQCLSTLAHLLPIAEEVP